MIVKPWNSKAWRASRNAPWTLPASDSAVPWDTHSFNRDGSDGGVSQFTVPPDGAGFWLIMGTASMVSQSFTASYNYLDLGGGNQRYGFNSYPTGFVSYNPAGIVTLEKLSAGQVLHYHVLDASGTTLINGDGSAYWSGVRLAPLNYPHVFMMAMTGHQSFPTPVLTQIAYDTIVWDPEGICTTGASAQVKFKTPGYWLLFAACDNGSNSQPGAGPLEFHIDANVDTRSMQGNYSLSVNAPALIQPVAGAVLTIWYEITNGGSPGLPQNCWLAGIRLGPEFGAGT